MDIQAYISSGILEAYALGDCTPQEMREVERMIATYPEVKEELGRIELSLESVAKTLAIPPSARLKQDILSAVEAEKRKSIPEARAEKPSHLRQVMMGIAASVGLLVAGYFYFQNQTLKTNLAQTQSSLDTCKTQNQVLLTSERQIAFLKNQNTRRFDIVPLIPNSIKRAAIIYTNGSDGQCLLSTQGMAAAPSGKSFQLWALVNGTPVSLGVMSSDSASAGFIEINCTPEAQGFAISLEPQGGSPTPTEVIMMSKS
jgi:anti-sigma-K factor RskA